MKRYLTKSRFQLGRECATKLFYTGKKEYGNTKNDNAFLSALAEGGFQVGALARLYYPTGIMVTSLDYETSLRDTAELLQRENVVIFEAAILFENYFIRIDILSKRGNEIELIEVKAKSFHPSKDSLYLHNKDGSRVIRRSWEPYLYDVAFQHYVLTNAYPDFTVKPFLFLTDKSAVASIDGLHQNFVITKGADNRAEVQIKKQLSPEELGQPLLIKVAAGEPVSDILNLRSDGKSFGEWTAWLSDLYEKDEKALPPIGSQCKNCEFRANSVAQLDGFQECWAQHTSKPGPYVLQLWRARYPDRWIQQKMFNLSDVTREMINPEPRTEGGGLSSTERQWLQIEKHTTNDRKPFLDREGLLKEMGRWKFPYHFVDFETCRAAIPFNKGQRPYATTAFQFSHHIVDSNGGISHTGEYINRKKGFFPNLEFLRKLKAELDKDGGSFFCYHIHELNVLSEISDQLETIPIDAGERKELKDFIRDINARAVDLCELVVRYYYHPSTNGSNSLKSVLPATLNESDYLQEKYSKPIYGAPGGLSSHNFKDFQWIKKNENNEVIDPYSLLSAFSKGEIDDIHEGGAAMIAYSRLQFTEIDEISSERIINSLLRYCELDTFATVLLYEHWNKSLKR